MLPESSDSTARPTNETISAFSPRPARPSSMTPAISWPKRTQRVHWGQRLRRLLDLDQAHAAVRRDRQFLVIAEMRHVNAELVGGVHYGRAVRHLDRFAVDLELEIRHQAASAILRSRCAWLRPQRGSI